MNSALISTVFVPSFDAINVTVLPSIVAALVSTEVHVTPSIEGSVTVFSVTLLTSATSSFAGSFATIALPSGP